MRFIIVYPMDTMIPEILVIIFNNLTLKELLTIESMSSYYKKIIRTNKWIKPCVVIRNDETLSHVLNNYKFGNLSVEPECNVNIFIHKLKNCHSLDLSWTNITDENIIELKNCHTL